MVVAILDLHGSLHENAASEVDNFFASNDPPFEIITGNSVKMQEIVRKVLKRYNLEAFYRHPNNLGSLIIINRIK